MLIETYSMHFEQLSKLQDVRTGQITRRLVCGDAKLRQTAVVHFIDRMVF